MKHLLFVLLIGTFGWGLVEWHQARRLRTEVDALAAARIERRRLQKEQIGPEQRRSATAGPMARPLRSAPAFTPALPPRPLPAVPAASLKAGDWVGAESWRARGQDTSLATVESALAAAAGGDVARFQQLIECDSATRTKIAALISNLPPALQAEFPSPELLVSAFAIKSIPVGQAQLVWHHETGSDEAIACVFLRNPDTPVGAADLTQPPHPETGKAPPRLEDPRATKSVMLTLRRRGDAWRLVVPESVAERITADLRPR